MANNEETNSVGDYEPFSSQYAANVDTKPIHIYYERPNTWSLLPQPLAGLKILDLGCGSGWYAEQLMRANAVVTAVDRSPTMVEITRRRLNDQGNFYVANIEEKMDFLQKEEFNIILAPLFIHYINDWQQLFSEISRVLKPNGYFIFSTHQPQTEVTSFNLQNYYNKVIIKDFWQDIQSEVKYYHHTLHELSEALYNSGMVIERLLEPQPLPEMATADSLMYHNIITKPWFLFIRALKIKA
jgi:ubiquinone/menaquinone biosynthesis C-methylase UbiE